MTEIKGGRKGERDRGREKGRERGGEQRGREGTRKAGDLQINRKVRERRAPQKAPS